MGLDMYLTGRKHKFKDYDNPENNETEDGFPVEEKQLRLGYWRKHPNLHGYIVEVFAGGEDDCKEIELSAEDLENLHSAIADDDLPHTEGFFFGSSLGKDDPDYQGYKNQDLSIIQGALDWLRSRPQNEWRSVFYRASW